MAMESLIFWVISSLSKTVVFEAVVPPIIAPAVPPTTAPTAALPNMLPVFVVVTALSAPPVVKLLSIISYPVIWL